ncbi:MAG: formate dehydrogenase subunit delta [Methylocystis sp.]|jgi:formate dehydrogenase subunit delta
MSSHSTVDTLVKMANQIGDFFSAQKSTDKVAGIVDHIQKFWDPRMRANIIKHLAEGGAGLNPLVLEAIKRLAQNTQSAGSK